LTPAELVAARTGRYIAGGLIAFLAGCAGALTVGAWLVWRGVHRDASCRARWQALPVGSTCGSSNSNSGNGKASTGGSEKQHACSSRPAGRNLGWKGPSAAISLQAAMCISTSPHQLPRRAPASSVHGVAQGTGHG